MTTRTYVYVKTVAPTVGDDTNDGYQVGDRWLDTTSDHEYVVLDVTAGAAVWRETTHDKDGWHYFGAVITRSSNTVFTLPGDAAYAAWLKGKVVKWTDTTTKRAVVTNATHGSGTVTVTIAGSALSATAVLTTVQWAEPREIIVVLTDPATDLSTGDDKISVPVPWVLDGWYCHFVSAYAKTAPAGATISIMLVNNGNDMLSTALTIDATENSSLTAATPPVVSETYWQIDAGNGLDVDVDQVGSGTAGAGVSVSWIFGPP